MDAIGVEASSGKVVLTISDHLDWGDETRHLTLLQDKLNAYVRFVESGELELTYPEAKGRTPVIDLVTSLEIPRGCAAFLDRVRAALADTGIELRTRPLPE